MTVRLTLVDVARGVAFAEVDLPPERLPETFAVAITLHLPDGDGSVEAAEPPTRAEAVAGGALRLTLRKRIVIDPKTIAFTLPTIENALPPVVPGDTAIAAPEARASGRCTCVGGSRHRSLASASLPPT